MSASKQQQSDGGRLLLEAVYALPERQLMVQLALAAGATLGQALEQLRRHPEFAEVPWAEVSVGIFGEVVTDQQRLLVAGDRIEIYRPLQLTPMQARRIRAENSSRSG